MKIIRELIPYLIIIAAVLCIRTYLFTPVQVDGISMEPTLEDGQILILNLFDKKYERFDVVVLTQGENRLVKRIVGLPGEKIEYKDNKLYINGTLIEELYDRKQTFDFTGEELGITVIPANHYFVLGDNRGNSSDSRYFGVISKDDIIGKTDLSLYPFNKFGFFK